MIILHYVSSLNAFWKFIAQIYFSIMANKYLIQPFIQNEIAIKINFFKIFHSQTVTVNIVCQCFNILIRK